jgi:hypothetical protein
VAIINEKAAWALGKLGSRISPEILDKVEPIFDATFAGQRRKTDMVKDLDIVHLSPGIQLPILFPAGSLHPAASISSGYEVSGSYTPILRSVELYRGAEYIVELVPKIKIEVIGVILKWNR